MKFCKIDKKQARDCTLIYDMNECSFNIPDRNVTAVNCEIAINYLTLQVYDSIIVCISGFCPYKGWKQTENSIQSYKKGLLALRNTLDYDQSGTYTYSDSFPMWFNPITGWFCLGDSEATLNGVEFLRNCIAVLNDSKDLVAIWLKPQFLNLGNKTMLEHIMSK
jgi:hypothetical protein